MYNHSSTILVKDLVPCKKIEIEWGAKEQPRSRVEWTFEPVEKDFTQVADASRWT